MIVRRRRIGMRTRSRRALGLAMLTIVGIGGLTTTPAGAATDGTWTVTTTPSDVRAVHATLLKTGKVLLIAGSGNDRNAFNAGTFTTSIWDPATGSLTSVSTPWDAFCAGHVVLADGRVLVAGGTTAYPSAATNNSSAGSDRSYLFDPSTGKYTRTADMHQARWYATTTELGDGRVLALGGLDEAGELTSQFEIFDGTSWSTPANGPSNYVFQPMYPGLHQMRDGRLFYSGVSTFGGNAAEVPPGLWDFTANTYQTVPGLTDDTRRDMGASVMLPPAQDQRIMVIGGGDQFAIVGAVSSTAIADLKLANPAFVPGPSLDAAKMYPSAVILPDSTVLATGGATKSVNYGGTPVTSTQIFNPKTNAWTKMASATVGRVYHSSAILLPDGRVATFGGNPLNSFEMRIEVFTPPYLETGTARPTLSGGVNDLNYGDFANYTTTQASAIRNVVLVRPGSATHSSDPNQRLIDVKFTRTANGVAVTMPVEPNLAPPGWYLMHVVDSAGVPSVAKWIHLEDTGSAPNGGYTLDGFGGLHPFGFAGASVAPAVERGPYWKGWDIARAAARFPNQKTGYVLDGFGGIHGFASAGAPLPAAAKGTPYWKGWDIARGIALLPNGTGGYVVDAFGGVHPFGVGSASPPPAITGMPYWPGQDRARGIAILPDGSGGYVTDVFGVVTPFRIGTGGATPPAVGQPFSPIYAPARGVALQPNGAAGFVLDGFGGLHGFGIAGGVALHPSGTSYWPGWVIARNVTI